MDILDEQLFEFWEKLNSNKVRYIMIGGFATRFYGVNRSTDDVDLWLDNTIENRKNLRKAFIELGYGDYDSLETMEFIPGWTTFHAGGIALDILTEMKGLDGIEFSDCLKIASIADINGLKIPFLHINHLIDNKKAINRPKDKVDVQELEKIRKIIEEG